MNLYDLHTFFVYVFFGYFFIFPIVLLSLKLFNIKHPKQRMSLYLLALTAPVVGFAMYHTVLTKRCQAGVYPQGLFWQVFDLFCRFGNSAIRFLTPVLIALIILGLLKALAGAVYVLRIRARAVIPNSVQQEHVAEIVTTRCRKWQMKVPDVIYTERTGFAAFTAGLFYPVVVISAPLMEYMSQSELEGILTHELVHIRRKDTLTGWALHILRDLMIFSPFSTLLLDRYMLERERLCDSEAVKELGRPHDYAATLIKVWRLIVERQKFSPGTAVGFTGKKHDLEQRVVSLLEGRGQDREMPAIMFFALIFSIAALTVLYLGFIC
jgi:beta-lactamase regulating signal transducer with metallopeptidase domain